MKIRIPLRPHTDEEPEPEIRPSLCGHIFDAETDEPIFGWVELSYGNPKVKDSKFQDKKDCWNEDKEYKERKEKEEPEDSEREEKTRCNEKEKCEGPEDCKRKELNRRRCEKPEDFFLWRTYSDREGFYEYFNVPPGHYEMRVFAKGHRMYYNEINIGDEPLFIDVYLLRERPKPKPYSIIYGRVLDRSTKEPVEGALVCVAPPELIKKVLAELKEDDQEPEPMSLDIDNIDEKLDAEIIEISDEDIEVELIEWDDQTQPDEIKKDIYENYDKETDTKSRGEDKKEDRENKEKPDRKPRPERPDPEKQVPKRPEPEKPEQPNKRLDFKKFCTRTDEKGYFELKVTPGAHVLIVRARGYELFAREFEIKPFVKMSLKVPVKPLEQEPLRTEDSSETSDSDTQGIMSSISTSTAGTSPVLATTLGVLVLIALILGALVWRRRHTVIKRKMKKTNKQ